MNRLLLLAASIVLAAGLLLGVPAVQAQQTAKVVSACGAVTYTPGSTNYVTLDVNGNTCGANSQTGGGSATSNPAVSFRQTATASAVALPSNTLTNGLVCQALSTNTGTLHVGGASVTSTANDYPLSAGQPISWGVDNSNLVYIVDPVTTDIISCTGN